MVESVLLAYALTLAPIAETGMSPLEAIEFREQVYVGLDVPGERLRLRTHMDGLTNGSFKVSPKNEYVFSHLTTAYAAPNMEEFQSTRFRIYSQSKEDVDKHAEPVGRMLLRMWDFNRLRLGLDHSSRFYLQSVDCYLCAEGRPGGEHLFDQDPDAGNGKSERVNTIYIYSLESFTNPQERAREVAHEYGHATLPAIGPFDQSAPESWANGDIGERMYIRWLHDAIALNKLRPDDAMGATREQLSILLNNRHFPDVKAFNSSGPKLDVLKRRDGTSFKHYLQMFSHCLEIMPQPVLARALVLTGSTNPEDFSTAAIAASEEREEWKPMRPPGVEGTYWIPLGKGKVSGAKISLRKAGWALIQPTGTVKITNQVEAP